MSFGPICYPTGHAVFNFEVEHIANISFYLFSQVLEKHRAMDSMVELLQVYPEEDEAYGDVLEATTQLYHYLLQPFRDMRELAMLRRQQIKVTHTQIPLQSVLRLGLTRC